MTTKEVAIPLGGDERVSGVVSIPENYERDRTMGVIFAHGDANDMKNPLIKFISRWLCCSSKKATCVLNLRCVVFFSSRRALEQDLTI
jgi:hypothetical protein